VNPQQLAVVGREYKNELLEELLFLNSKILKKTPSLYWIEKDDIEPAWAQCIWRKIKPLPIRSITDAQRQLQAISKQWSYLGDAFHRRGALISEKLDLQNSTSPYAFPPTPSPGTPAFTLMEPHLIFYSLDVQRVTASGAMQFSENKIEPPSRAYLKLWEALTLLGDWPKKGDDVLDLGSCPGSWTWVLANLGANVLSVDRSAIHPSLHLWKNIQFRSGDAFSFHPRKMDWVFSDVICFPEKLFDLIQIWIQSKLCKKFICSVKFTGKPDPQLIDQFRQLPHSRILHLYHNKNEVTWISHPKIY
jgi:23S rRNA (cytidine2498-2'-O)-methyltransferase